MPSSFLLLRSIIQTHSRRRKNPRRSPSPERRDWGSLPSDVLLEVFRRLPTADILCGAGQTCTAWRSLSSDEPELWRHVDLLSSAPLVRSHDRRQRIAMGRAALDRSAGRCEGFSGWVDGELLRYIAAGSPALRSLRARSLRGACKRIPSARLVRKVVRELPLLEELVLSRTRVRKGDHEVVILDHCPSLEQLHVGGGCGPSWNWATGEVPPLRQRRITEFLMDLRRFGFAVTP